MTLLEMSAVLEANHGPTIYDRTFSNPEAEHHADTNAGDITAGES